MRFYIALNPDAPGIPVFVGVGEEELSGNRVMICARQMGRFIFFELHAPRNKNDLPEGRGIERGFRELCSGTSPGFLFDSQHIWRRKNPDAKPGPGEPKILVALGKPYIATHECGVMCARSPEDLVCRNPVFPFPQP